MKVIPKKQERIQKQEQWKRNLVAWEKSGMNQTEYCRQNGLSIKVFGYWKRKTKRDKKAVRFVKIPDRVNSACSIPSAPLLLSVDKRFILEIKDHFNTETLKQVLHTLQSL